MPEAARIAVLMSGQGRNLQAIVDATRSGRLRAEVAAILAADAAKRDRLAEIIADPACARPEELTAHLVEKVFAARLGHAATGTLMVAGLPCHRDRSSTPAADVGRWRDEDRLFCWWTDSEGQRRGDLPE